MSVVNSLCSAQNGQCSTYCLPTASGRRCACEDGLSLQSDGRTCQGGKVTTIAQALVIHYTLIVLGQ